ncbi:hypothetical protein G5V59_12825 [Nocardioides sp. W3-2-3]|nr:hypothetical protein [Nocardioides convexus]
MAASQFNKHYVEIQRLLTNLIDPTNGPFLLVLWTDATERVEELQQYLTDHAYEGRPHLRPVSILPLSKNDFMNGAGDLVGAVRECLAGSPALAALLDWEVDVAGAAARVISGALALATSPRVTDAEAGPTGNLATLLKKISTEAVGKENLDAHPRLAIHAAFLPLLQDHLQHIAHSDGNIWSEAFSEVVEPMQETQQGAGGRPQYSSARDVRRYVGIDLSDRLGSHLRG